MLSMQRKGAVSLECQSECQSESRAGVDKSGICTSSAQVLIFSDRFDLSLILYNFFAFSRLHLFSIKIERPVECSDFTPATTEPKGGGEDRIWGGGSTGRGSGKDSKD